MSWFGETFGDSLSSLKGQISKITKEVLADDEAVKNERQEPENQVVKELEALCQAKDLEIASLKDEFQKIHNQYNSQIEFLKNENKTKINGNVCDNNGLQIQKLESELVQLRLERDHLCSSLEKLQSEHESNVDQIISLKNKYESELEVLKRENSLVKVKLNKELVENTTERINKGGTSEFGFWNSKTDDLHLPLDEDKHKSLITTNEEEENQNLLKQQLEKLLSDIQIINKDKEKIEEERRNIQIENECLKNELSVKEQKHKESEINLKLLLNEKEELIKKCEKTEAVESKLSVLIKIETEVQEKLENLLGILDVDVKEILNKNTTVELISLIENKVQELSVKYKELNENHVELTNNMESELQKLREENRNIHKKLKAAIENGTEMERKYQEEISLLKSTISEMKTQEQDCINQSQTDDVKKLEQEIAQYMSVIHVKNSEITDYSKSLNNLKQELENLKASSLKIEEELLRTKNEKKSLEEDILNLKNSTFKVNEEKVQLREKLRALECDKIILNQTNSELQKKVEELEKQMVELRFCQERIKVQEEELKKASGNELEVQKRLEELEKENLNLKNEFENLKSQITVKESSLAELMKANMFFQEEMNKLQHQNNELLNSEKEIKKWKDVSIELQIQQEDLIARKEQLESECFKLKKDLETGLQARDSEIEKLKQTVSNLMKSLDELNFQLGTKAQGEQSSLTEENRLNKVCQEHTELILQLQEENNELKCRIQKFQEQMKMQMFQSQSETALKDDVQQHRRSKSEINSEVLDLQKASTNSSDDLALPKEVMEQEQMKYEALQHQFQEIVSKEASARKEFERLKQHLIEVEEHYTEEAVENEKIISDLKSKLVAAEEQLQNSSTLYTSLKIRDNQHLESLQSQIRMVSAQRDDFQVKLSAAEDEVQKHKASLMSLQIVLEQFQQDKEQEIEEVGMKYEKQLRLSSDHCRDLVMEIQALKNQLMEAKKGLKAASRLGEQLEKKTQQITELEENLGSINSKVVELEKSLASANQASSEKIDRSLIKNLVVGYVLSPSADRKLQVLRIMASVLNFEQDERNKMGIDASHSGWLSNILNPQGGRPANSQSLSEAFIRFLENESRPQPQLKLLPEQLQASASGASRTSPKPSGHLPELILPTFNSSQENESSIILKNVLKDS